MKKLVIIVILGLVVSFLSALLSEPPPSLVEREYKDEFASASRELLSEREFEELVKKGEGFLEEVNSPENTRAALGFIAKRKVVIVPSVVLILFLVGLRFGFRDKRFLVVSSIILAIAPLVFVNIVETLIYMAAFVIGNIFFLKRLRTGDSARTAPGSAPDV